MGRISTNWQTIIEHGILSLILVAILKAGKPSYVDLNVPLTIVYYSLTIVLAILIIALIGIAVYAFKKILKKKENKPIWLVPLLIILGLLLTAIWKLASDHEADWNQLTISWSLVTNQNQTDSMAAFQEKHNCCGFKDSTAYQYGQLRESCIEDDTLKDICSNVLRNEAFLVYFIILGIFAVYLVCKVFFSFCHLRNVRKSGCRRTDQGTAPVYSPDTETDTETYANPTFGPPYS